MSTFDDHIKRAATVLGVLRKHGADVADLADDVPKLIEIADDLRKALPPPEPEQHQNAGQGKLDQTGGLSSMTKPPAAPSVPRRVEPQHMPAQEAAHRVRQQGSLAPEQRAAFDRESQQFG